MKTMALALSLAALAGATPAPAQDAGALGRFQLHTEV